MKKIILNSFILVMVVITACDVEIPEKEDVPETITKIELTFESDEHEAVHVSAADPDVEGIRGIEPSDTIRLKPNTVYSLSLRLINELALPGDEDYEISEEVKEEADEHRFYFGFKNNIFHDPSGDGNIDVGSDALNYLDLDANGLPLGIETQWTTSDSGNSSFRIMLKHQPDGLKTETADASVGETDLDVSFDLIVK